MTDPSPLVTELSVQAFRSIRDLTIHPGMVGALVGEAGAGKSNLLAAIRAVLDPRATVGMPDVPRLAPTGDTAEVAVSAKLRDGGQCAVRGVPPAMETVRAEGVEVVYSPAFRASGQHRLRKSASRTVYRHSRSLLARGHRCRCSDDRQGRLAERPRIDAGGRGGSVLSRRLGRSGRVDRGARVVSSATNSALSLPRASRNVGDG